MENLLFFPFVVYIVLITISSFKINSSNAMLSPAWNIAYGLCVIGLSGIIEITIRFGKIAMVQERIANISVEVMEMILLILFSSGIILLVNGTWRMRITKG